MNKGMKKLSSKRYKCNRKSVVIILLIYFLIGEISFIIGAILSIIDLGFIGFKELDFIAQMEFIMFFIWPVIIPIIFIVYLCPLGFCVLDVNDDAIIWRCPCHKTVKLHLAQCKYVGIAKLKRTKHIKTPEIRGDELCYIYLSSSPVTQKTKERITWKLPRKGLIYFSYSDELCLHLIEILPSEKTTELLIFYNRMQAMDRVREREKKIAEMKERKKKERKNKRTKS